MSSPQPPIAPCIFCGSTGAAVVDLYRGNEAPVHHVVCDLPECLAAGPVRATVDAAIKAWNGVVPHRGALPFTHWTCGTGHLRAERTLQIIAGVGAFDFEAMEMIATLVDEAGYDNAVRATQDDLPF